MKKAVFLLVVGLIAMGLLGTAANALTYDFDDSVNYWDGWKNNSGDDNKDTIGIPNILGGQVSISHTGWLESITFDFEKWGGSIYSKLAPGDLFLDFGSDKNWDRVVYINWTDTIPAGTNYDGTYDLYEGNLGLNASGYKESGADNSGYWKGYNIRHDHAIGLNPTAAGWTDTGLDVGFSGWGGTQIKFEFTNFYVGNQDLIALGWGVNCANDVVYEKIKLAPPIPEPTMLLLLGSGLLGIVAVGRKKFQK